MTQPRNKRITRNDLVELTGVSKPRITKVTQLGLFGFPVSRGVLSSRELYWDRAEVMAWLLTHDLKTLNIYKEPKPFVEPPAKSVMINGISFLEVFSGKYATPEEQQSLLSRKIKARNNKPITTLNPTGYK